MRRRFMKYNKPLVLYTKRFFPEGTYKWDVPSGCTAVDVFLVGGGGGGSDGVGGGSGRTSYYKDLKVTPGESITIVVGKGGTGAKYGTDGYTSWFRSLGSGYTASGGECGTQNTKGGDGGSGGGGVKGNGGSNGSSGDGIYERPGGYGQGYSTEDFLGNINAGGGSGESDQSQTYGGSSSYSEGRGKDGILNWSSGYAGKGGGGYGGGGGGSRGSNVQPGNGGDGTVLIRYYAY